MSRLLRMTVQQAAERLGITDDSVTGAIRRGALKADRVGKYWLIWPEELERYAVARNREPGEISTICAKCGGPRTWDYHAYCQDCNNAYRKAWRERKREISQSQTQS